MAVVSLLGMDFCAELAVRSLLKKKYRGPHFYGSRPCIYEVCSMQTDVGIGDSITVFIVFRCILKKKAGQKSNFFSFNGFLKLGA